MKFKSVLGAILIILWFVSIGWAASPVYCWHGSAQDDGDATWNSSTIAYLTAALALAAVDAGGVIHIASDHSETPAGILTLASTNSTDANPVTIISTKRADDTYEPMVTGGGSLDGKTNEVPIYFSGAYDIFCGLKFTSGTDIRFMTTDKNQLLYDCQIEVDASIELGYGTTLANKQIYWEDCDIISTVGITEIRGRGCNFRWRGGTFSFSGGNAVTLFDNGDRASRMIIEDVDFQDLDGSDYLVKAPTSNAFCEMEFIRCKVPAALAGLMSGAVAGGEYFSVKFHSVSASDEINQFKEYYFMGYIEDETGIYLDATYDGTNGYSAKMVSNANADVWTRPLRFKLAEIYVSTINQVLTVELLTTDAAAAETLHTNDFWIEVEYPDSTIAAFGRILSTKETSILGGGTTELTTSAKGTGDWTGELANNNFYKSVADFTGVANEAVGIYTVWGCLAKPSTTAYLCPKVDVQ